MEFGINVYHRDEMDVCFIDWNTQEWFATEAERDAQLADYVREAEAEKVNPKHRLHFDVKSFSKIEKQIA